MAANPLDKLNKIPTAFKAIGLVVVVVGIVAGFYFMVWSELDKEADKLRSEKVSLERKYNEQKAVADNLPSFQQNTRKLEEDLNTALKQLPREPEVPSLLRDIYTLGKKSGVKFKTFEPQRMARKKLYAELPIRLQLTGKYHEVAVFFDRIGKMSRIVNISELDVSKGAGKDGEPELNVSCQATTFMFTGGVR